MVTLNLQYEWYSYLSTILKYIFITWCNDCKVYIYKYLKKTVALL